MPPKGRHRRPPPGAAKAKSGGDQITGKRATQAKNQRYARPLPVDADALWAGGPSQQKQKQKEVTWSQWFASWFPRNDASVPSTSVIGSSSEAEPPLIAYWDPVTSSAWVQVTAPGITRAGNLDETSRLAQQTRSARALWDSGFFGKGSLSRSEPTWRTRKINEERVKIQRQRGMKAYTPEELTAMRRRERMAAKIERARLAVRAGQQLPDGIVALGGTLTEEEEALIANRAAKEVEDEDSLGEGNSKSAADTQVEEEYGKHIPGLIYLAPKKEEDERKALSADEMLRLEEEENNVSVEDVEWLHVSPCEVFFLAGMLGVLDVHDAEDKIMPLQSLYEAFLSSHLPHPLRTSQIQSPPGGGASFCRPDNPFLLSYVAYHHYRSLGWAVKSGIKFCADWLLYKRGPVFGHAEFAVLVVPVYEDPADEASSPFPRHPAAGDRDWVWFSTMNRVQTQVLKTLVLAHITIPPLSRATPETLRTPEALVDGLRAGRLHTVREVSLRRWVPARMRG